MSLQSCINPGVICPEAVMVVNLSREDSGALATMFADLPVRLIQVGTAAQCMREAMSQPVRVVVCERDLPDGDWKHLFENVGALEHPPRVIVACRVADERLWAEVLNLGGYNVLATPFDADEVQRVISSAVASWH